MNIPPDHQDLIGRPLTGYDHILGMDSIFELYTFNLCAVYLKIRRMCYVSLTLLKEVYEHNTPTQVKAMLRACTQSQKVDIERILNYLKNHS